MNEKNLSSDEFKYKFCSREELGRFPIPLPGKNILWMSFYLKKYYLYSIYDVWRGKIFHINVLCYYLLFIIVYLDEDTWLDFLELTLADWLEQVEGAAAKVKLLLSLWSFLNNYATSKWWPRIKKQRRDFLIFGRP